MHVVCCAARSWGPLPKGNQGVGPKEPHGFLPGCARVLLPRLCLCIWGVNAVWCEWGLPRCLKWLRWWGKGLCSGVHWPGERLVPLVLPVRGTATYSYPMFSPHHPCRSALIKCVWRQEAPLGLNDSVVQSLHSLHNHLKPKSCPWYPNCPFFDVHPCFHEPSHRNYWVLTTVRLCSSWNLGVYSKKTCTYCWLLFPGPTVHHPPPSPPTPPHPTHHQPSIIILQSLLC